MPWGIPGMDVKNNKCLQCYDLWYKNSVLFQQSNTDQLESVPTCIHR